MHISSDHGQNIQTSSFSSQPVITVKNFECGYGAEPILTDVNFTVAHGAGLGLIGANGSGKSTLLKGIIGLCRTSGEVTHAGGIGYVPQHQDVDLSFPVTARQVVEMGLYPQTPWWKKVDAKKVNDAIALVELSHKAGDRFGDLSGGQRQRILIARALVTDPNLVLLDEPFNGLDVASRQVLVDTIRTLKAQGTAVIISTHDYDLADQVCEHSAKVGNGKVAIFETAQVIKASNEVS
ncbi:metal ABC transporter ATP-binding protein [Corynebacterium sp. HS2168-gen11]|uniref:metal ABC transporter ATP-binding protein n=1 Tax=Corynebacterium sp. HS2168-gen11 TaxID=2974027 RepID=UPI00216B3CFB|nr:metal ABC transporter ATP-binding protein [Corynebacterium sp. HS2168-gen11]MCS4535993.1 metal ABC transporter ATP-binding protein [Corynebacterium sp. HS2168-gen11]